MGESLRFAFVMPQLGSVSIRLVAAISRFPFADFNALPSISQPRMATGHLNPSLPLARSLIQLGHEVHYLSRAWSRVLSHEVSESGRGSCVLLGTSFQEAVRAAIEKTGASFTDAAEVARHVFLMQPSYPRVCFTRSE